MTSILKVDELQDTSGNLIIKEDSNTITIGASGDTITIPSGATITNSGTATGFGGITEADFWRVTTAFTGSVNPVASNWERCDESTFAKIGTGMSQSSGVWTFPSTGLWYIVYYSAFSLGSAVSRYVYNTIETTPDNSNWTERAVGWGSVFNGSGGTSSSVKPKSKSFCLPDAFLVSEFVCVASKSDCNCAKPSIHSCSVGLVLLSSCIIKFA